MTDQPLFDITPTAKLVAGDKVRFKTMFGLEVATVVDLRKEPLSGFPMVTLDTESGDRISVDVARAYLICRACSTELAVHGGERCTWCLAGQP